MPVYEFSTTPVIEAVNCQTFDPNYLQIRFDKYDNELTCSWAHRCAEILY